MEYIYKYERKDNNEIVYIGRTIDINERHYRHTLNDNWCKESELNLYYAEINNRCIEGVEKKLIQRYHPKYNDKQYETYVATYEIFEAIHFLEWNLYKY